MTCPIQRGVGNGGRHFGHARMGHKAIRQVLKIITIWIVLTKIIVTEPLGTNYPNVASQESMKRPPIVVYLSAGLAVFAIVAIIALIRKRETLESVCEKTTHAIITADGRTYLEYMSKLESEAYGLNAEQWSKAIEHLCGKQFTSWVNVSTPILEYSEPTETLNYRQVFIRPSGESVELSIMVGRSDTVPKHYLNLGSLIATISKMKYPQKPGTDKRLSDYYSVRDLLESEAEELRILGLHGLFDSQTQRIMTWDEFKLVIDTRIKRRESTR